MSEQVQSIGPKQAWEICQQNPRALLVDIRSSMEFLFVGHPEGAVHVPWIDEPDWTINENFVTDVRKLMLGGIVDGSSGVAPVLLICRSGQRSLEAAEKLIEAGISNVYNVDEGFEGELDDEHHRSTLGGWRYHNLPWQQC